MTWRTIHLPGGDPSLQIRRMNQPDAAALIARLNDMSDSINIGCIELHRHQSIDKVDALLARVKTAEQTLIHIRKALLHDQEVRRD